MQTSGLNSTKQSNQSKNNSSAIPISQFLKSLTQLDRDELNTIKGIGPKISDNLINYLNSSNYLQLIEKFQKLENQNDQYQISLSNQLRQVNNNPNSRNIAICITGTFSETRDTIKQTLEQNGYKVTNTVNSQTDYLLCGEKAGSKLKQATNLKIPLCYSLTELLEKLKGLESSGQI